MHLNKNLALTSLGLIAMMRIMQDLFLYNYAASPPYASIIIYSTCTMDSHAIHTVVFSILD